MGHRKDQAVQVAGAPLDQVETVLWPQLGLDKWIPGRGGQWAPSSLWYSLWDPCPTCPRRPAQRYTHGLGHKSDKGGVVHICDSSSQEAEVTGSLRVQVQPALHDMTMFQKKKKKK